ncbi:acyltransferase family protein [Guptibacillus hwajinpoensis]|uniref:Surface polysaccharide O-acyltransferase-like enzyme n=1 Tax=Guptibacillus hwajinpoensis TaxID=208199 RepID=A0ABU0K2Y8_9BACL|nr:acyltransferase [Alkalihalobacillus hemicentroti]MDQ0482517.1 surface polysaccharide O-acyltransferase-like enzyme [Alkalihalobacillus hemicentroti]
MQKANQEMKMIFFLSAITCIGILLIHVSNLFRETVTTSFVTADLPGVAMFAVIAGMLFVMLERSVDFDRKRFYQSGFVKIVLPFVGISILYLAITKIVMEVSIFTGWKTHVLDFAMGNSYYHLYLVAAALQFYLIFPLLQLIRSKMSWSILLAISFIVNTYFLFVHSPDTATVIGQILGQKAILVKWIFFFVFGAFLAHHSELVQSIAKKLNWKGFASFIGVIGFIIYDRQAMGAVGESSWTLMLSIPILTISLLALYELVKKVILLDLFLEAIGRNTFGVYLIYPLVLFVFSTVLPEEMLSNGYFGLVFTLVLGTSVFINKAMSLSTVKEAHKKGSVSHPYTVKTKELSVN